MGYRPPKGVRPPQLEGKRTGRPKGSKNGARARQQAIDEACADVLWAYRHRNAERANVPNAAAYVWWWMAAVYPKEVKACLQEFGKL